MNNLLLAGMFLLIVSLSQVIAGTAGYILTKGEIELYQLPSDGQTGLLAVAEISIIASVLLVARIVRKIPSKITKLTFFTITIPLIVNIIILALMGDTLYDSMYQFNEYWESIVLMLISSFIIMTGSICNIVMLEYYLNVKYIEAEKNIRINEMSQQYDYYVKLEKETDNIKRLAHDFRNHLEALKSDHDNEEKQEYVRSIEKRLERYECYYRTGNTFVDSILQSKAQQAADSGIEFKVIADFRPFQSVKNEDLCTIIANIVDNALRECSLIRMETPEEECIIQVKARRTLNFLWIYCENSIREKQAKIVSKATELKTTKDDKQNHGYGIKNVESAANKYGGEIAISIRDDLFCISITIPTREES
nr:sensor histidine kinase [uncultured Schaedlerella sp.]